MTLGPGLGSVLHHLSPFGILQATGSTDLIDYDCRRLWWYSALHLPAALPAPAMLWQLFAFELERSLFIRR